MTPELLLQECDLLTHNGRMRRMVELGRLASSDPGVATTLAILALGNVYQRILALQSCFGSCDSSLVIAAISDPSRSVRSLALDLVPVVCSDVEILTILEVIPLKMKTALLRHLSRRRQHSAIDPYLEKLATDKDAAFKALLPFASFALVERLLDLVIDVYELSDWMRLARFHPSIAVAQLRKRMPVAGIPDQRLILQVNAVLPLLTRLDPDLALELVRAMIAVVPLARLKVDLLAKQRAPEITDLLLQSDELNTLNINVLVSRLDIQRLLALLTRYPVTLSSAVFRRLTPAHRLAVYTLCERSWRNSEGVLPFDIVLCLPTEQRIQEERRHLALPSLATRPLVQLLYTAFLPWDEARLLLEPSLRSPDADLRAVSLRALITSIRFQHNHLADALVLVRQRRNEQDPVRRAIFTALDAVPYALWQEEHLNDLAQVIRDALNAADLSPITLHAVAHLVLHLLPLHPAWAATQLPSIYLEHGRVNVFSLDSFLSDADIRHIAPFLLPVLQAWQEREYEGQILLLAQSFGRRLRVFDALLDLLETMLEYSRSNGVISSILNLISQHAHQRLSRLVPYLLGQDKSFSTLAPVYNYLHRYRQDLLTPFLGRNAYVGRFTTGRVSIVLSFHDGFFRWTPMQQELFAQTLLAVANDEKQPTPFLINALHQLGNLSMIDPSYIIKYASDTHLPVRDTALRVLGTLDAGQGISTLLDALNDDRARIAIYALRAALLTMPESQALALLRAVPMTKVTVAKEVVRLIGDLSSEAAFRELQAIEKNELHRDVRVALLRAFWSYTERTETWEIFARAAQSSDQSLARGVIAIPADGLSPFAQERLALLLASVLARPEPAVRVEVLQRCMRNPCVDSEKALLPGLFASLNSLMSDECSLAARALFALYEGSDALLVGDTVRKMLSNRRSLQTLVGQYVLHLSYNRQRLFPTTRAILAALAQDRLTLSLQISLMFAGLPWEESISMLQQLADSLHPDALSKVEIAIQQSSKRPDADLSNLEMTLASSPDERLRRLAFASLLAQSARSNGWSDALIARLQIYRADPSPLVAEVAQFTFVPD